LGRYFSVTFAKGGVINNMKWALAVFFLSLAVPGFSGWARQPRTAAALLGSGVATVKAQQSAATAPQSAGPAAPASKSPSKPTAQPSGKKEHTFRGTVEKVDANARTLTVDGENVPGWMAKMTMTYRVDKAETLTVKAGDHITAKVYDGDTSTLYEVRIVAVKPADANELPPLSYVCDTQGEDIAVAAAQSSVIEERPGKCPPTGAPLVPVRLDTVYSCLKFQSFIQEKPGVCPVDKSELVPITVGLYFTCKNDSKVRQLEQGNCADGSARIRSYERRPHGDHNPRHGGQFFMADDSWHHLEGTFLRPNVFRVYFYNDFTQPLAVTGFSATAVKADANGGKIAAPVILKAGRTKDRNTLEALMQDTTLPASFELRVKFKPNDKERVFDFTFADYSKEPVPASLAPGASAPIITAATRPKSQTRATTAPSRAARDASNGPAASPAKTAMPTPAPQTGGGDLADSVPLYPYSNTAPGTIGLEEPLPTTTPELLTELAKRAQSVKMLLDEGNLPSLWYPAIRAKDVALALEESHMNDIQEAQRAKMASAVKRLTLAAWQIDAAGDLGNKELLLPLYREFSAAITDIQSAYATQ
jgi:Cu/Ag efflux protein CusF